MKEYPILFSTEMVRAILDGHKTQTRRVMKPQPPGYVYKLLGPKIYAWGLKCPYGQPGDFLWVRETFVKFDPSHWPPKYGYRADMPTERGAWLESEEARKDLGYKWKPSIFMPKSACRIWLEIIDVRVEQVQDITTGDILSEGIGDGFFAPDDIPMDEVKKTGDFILKQRWAELWDSINAKRGYGWDVNPLVWVITFKRIERQS